MRRTAHTHLYKMGILHKKGLVDRFISSQHNGLVHIEGVGRMSGCMLGYLKRKQFKHTMYQDAFLEICVGLKYCQYQGETVAIFPEAGEHYLYAFVVDALCEQHPEFIERIE